MMGLAEIWARLRGAGASATPNAQAGATARNSERGRRPTPENSLKYQYRQMWVDPDVRQSILDVREMDRQDGRVRRIHGRIARDAVKGGLVFTQTKTSRALAKAWEGFARRLQLSRVEKLKSDARGLAMEGNLPLQWVIDDAQEVVAAVRMPSETILPNVDAGGRFKDVTDAFWQIDMTTGTKLAGFPLWQLFLCRFDPDSFDDMGAMGRPFLDASREVWRKLRMTEEDLVIRRRHRAPLRLSHVLEGASPSELSEYQARVENEKGEITTDFYSNRKGAVSAVQGDATLGDIGDVVHLLDTFFSGTPAPKGLMGYTEDMARDILEDLKRDYYEEVDVFQDTLSFAYAEGFRLQLLLKGIVPDPEEYWIGFAERRTETPNQTVDRMLKWRALGMPQDMIFEEMGFNATAVRRRIDAEVKRGDPYPAGAGSIGRDPLHGEWTPGPPRVNITPGNAPKGESATSIGVAAAEQRNGRRPGEFLLYDQDQPRVPAGNQNGGQWVGDNKEAGDVVVNLIKKPGTFGVTVEVLDDGRVDVFWPGFGESPGRLRDKVQGAVLEKFRPKMNDGVFWRFTNNKDELSLAAAGKLKPSMNHADGFSEIGVSVASGAHYSAQGYKYGYKVRGTVLGTGSDGEPLLDPRTVAPVSGLLPSSEVAKQDRQAAKEILKNHGWSYEQLRSVANGRFNIK